MRKFRPAKTLAEANARLEMCEHMLEKMHEHHRLALTGTVTETKAVVEPIEPDVPPDAVLAAIKAISPVQDPTYEANWRHWERNKERARLNPEGFAKEILEGDVDFTPPVSVLMVPDRMPVT